MPEEVFAAKCSDTRLVGDRYNLRADLFVGAEKTLVIYAHLDVVPAEGNWDTAPFQVVQKTEEPTAEASQTARDLSLP